MSVWLPCLIRSSGTFGEPVVRLGLAPVDDYLEFLECRSRRNTVLAAAYDLKVFFGVVAKAPDEVRAADVLGFITSQRAGHADPQVVAPVDETQERGGVASSTVARRLSTVSGFFAYLQARGDIAEGKGGHQRLVPISSRFFAAVAAYLETERPAAADTDRVSVVLKGPNRGNR